MTSCHHVFFLFCFTLLFTNCLYIHYIQNVNVYIIYCLFFFAICSLQFVSCKFIHHLFLNKDSKAHVVVSFICFFFVEYLTNKKPNWQTTNKKVLLVVGYLFLTFLVVVAFLIVVVDDGFL